MERLHGRCAVSREEGPLFKMSMAVYRLPQLSRPQFIAYWRDVHAPLVRRVSDAMRIRRYVQLHGQESELTAAFTASRSLSAPHDGVAELWWDSEQDLIEAARSEAGRAAGRLLKEDEARFTDLARSTVVFGREHPVVGDVTGVKR